MRLRHAGDTQPEGFVSCKTPTDARLKTVAQWVTTGTAGDEGTEGSGK